MKRGVSAEAVMIAAAAVILATVLLVACMAEAWTGTSVGEQIYHALFELKDWS